MLGETKAGTVEPTAASDADASKRERSSISFPYSDLNSALEVSSAIHGNVGLGDCSTDQLAAWLKVSAKSSGLRLQLATARLFGLMDSDGPERLRLTALGRRVADPNQARRAKADAFLTIPLYRAVFDKYRGGVLPPAAALERDMASLGVAEKQKDRARQVFERSAEQAGFFEHGRDRLVEPAVRDGGTNDAGRQDNKPTDNEGGGGGGGKPPLDPLLRGLVDRLPAADKEWSLADRVKWLQTAANIFDLIYKGDGGIKIEAAISPRSPRPD